MKSVVTLTIMIILNCFCAAQSISWSNPIDVADRSFGNNYPRIELNDKLQPVITWGGNNKVYISKLEDSSFRDPIQLNNDTTLAYVADWTGPELAVQGETIYATFMHNDWGKKTYIVGSFDGGITFTPPTLIENYSDHSSRFPMVTVDGLGNPIVSYMKMTAAGHDPNYVVATSNNQGMIFDNEQLVGQWSGTNSEACDCCPGKIMSEDETIVVLYRDNKNNVRDIWATISRDNAQTFPEGIPVDDSNWVINSCPASGPDGILIDDRIYTVFLSKSKSYLSIADLSTMELISLENLGAGMTIGNQNFPRIAHFENQVGITWKETTGGNNIMIAFYQDINDVNTVLFDTLVVPSYSTADIAISGDMIHIVYQDQTDRTVKYLTGSFQTSNVKKVLDQELSIFPNPSSGQITIKGEQPYDRYQIIDLNGRVVLRGRDPSINPELHPGIYSIEFFDREKKIKTNKFIRI